jgi:hypothetical protein
MDEPESPGAFGWGINNHQSYEQWKINAFFASYA